MAWLLARRRVWKRSKWLKKKSLSIFGLIMRHIYIYIYYLVFTHMYKYLYIFLTFVDDSAQFFCCCLFLSEYFLLSARLWLYWILSACVPIPGKYLRIEMHKKVFEYICYLVAVAVVGIHINLLIYHILTLKSFKEFILCAYSFWFARDELTDISTFFYLCEWDKGAIDIFLSVCRYSISN